MHLRFNNLFWLTLALSSALSLMSLSEVAAQQFQNVHEIKVDKDLKNGLLFDWNPSYIETILSSRSPKLSLSIPFYNNQSIQLELEEINIHAHGFSVIERSESGDSVIPYEAGRYFRGTISGKKNTKASIAIHGDEVSGVIYTNHNQINLGKLKNGNQHVIYRKSDLALDQDMKCSTLPNYDSKIELGSPAKSTSCSTAVDIYFECDYQMYQNHGSNSVTTTNYVNTLFTEVASLYASESLTIQISEIVIWSTNDGYANGTSGLTSFSTALNSSGFNGDLAHLLTNDSGSHGGVAYVDQLCGSFPYAYSDINNTTQPVPTYSWDVQVVAHELGHNFGSSHTHDCVWGPNGNQQIDDCGNLATGGGGSCYNSGNPIIPGGGGTIMSYCHLNSVGINFNVGFGNEPGDLIRSRHSSCMCDNSTCETASVITGTGTYFAQPESGNGASNAHASHADWFEFTPTTSGTIDVASCNEGVDTRLWIHSGTCSSLNFVATSDDDCTSAGSSTYASELTGIAVTAGATYFIEWDSRWSTASFSWTLSFTSGPSALVEITCPQDVMSENNCDVSDFDPIQTGSATSTTPNTTITYSDVIGNTSCSVTVDRTWLATDANGNSSNCSQFIDLTDNTGPMVTSCPGSLTFTSGANCLAVVTYPSPIGTDACGAVSATSTHTPGTALAIGTHSIFHIFTDRCNNTSNCAFSVTVLDGCSGGSTLDPCDASHLSLGGSILEDTYNAENTLQAHGFINPGQNPVFKAGQSLELKPGFELKAGATLEAVIEGCN